METSGISNASSSGLFTDLDPLGTGKSKPYVDKKDFFSELKSTSPKLGSMSNNDSRESPVNFGSMEVGVTHQQQQCPPDVSLSCSVSSNTSFVHNTSQRSSLRSANQNLPTPPPRSGSELTYGHLDTTRRSLTSSDTMPRQPFRGFGFSSHLSHPSTSSTSRISNTSTITSLVASSWRNQPSGVQDTRLYHTLGRPMTTFNNTDNSIYNTIDTNTTTTLKVSLPPDNAQDSNGQEQQRDTSRYGSIPHLEASPRRYNRLKDQSEYHYDISGTHLPLPSSAAAEIPPKLPEKPSRRNNQGSPPPLPPKKPTKGLIGITSFNKPSVEESPPPCQPDVIIGHDIYDFPPMPMLGSLKLDKEEAKQCFEDILQSSESKKEINEATVATVSVEELSKMSLIDLNAKLQSGQLPEEMKGMSILELVEYINEEMKKSNDIQNSLNEELSNNGIVAASAMKPSFSDNFVCDNFSKSEQMGQTAAIDENEFEPPLSTTSKEIGFAFPNVSEMPSGIASTHHRQLHHHFPDEAVPVSVASSSGFDDDFTPLSINQQTRVETSLSIPTTASRPESQAASEHSALSQRPDNEYDKYAVFRELQLEEDLIRAWRTPSEEERPEEEENEAENNETLQQEHEEEEETNYEDNEEPELLDEEDPIPQPVVCSSEGSPISHSDTQSPIKSIEKVDEEENEEAIEELPNKRESQLPIYNDNEDEESVTQSIKSANEENFFKTPFGSVQTNNWTTFDDEGPEMIPEQQQQHPRKIYNNTISNNSENAFQDNFGDTDWGTTNNTINNLEYQEDNNSITSKPEPSAPVRQHSSESQHSHSKCKRFSHRHVDDDHICSRGHSLEASDDVASYNTDWWPPSAEVGAPVKKPVTKMGTGNEAYSSTPDHKPTREENVFAEPLEAKFKIFSKVVNNGINDRSLTPLSGGFNDQISDNDSGIIPKSDSVNIFSIKDDPFDDDFFH